MIVPTQLAHIVPDTVEGICNCLVEGSAISSLVWLFLRLTPRRNSGTRFAILFSTLIMIAVLPLVNAWTKGAALSSGHSGITIPAAVAYWIFWGWLALAGAGLARVAGGLWQIWKLRKGCIGITPTVLHPELQQALDNHCSGPISVCTSSRLEVPSAIGFLKPAIVLPDWLMQEASPAELEHIVLHELAHLRRYDAWTNLAQKILRSMLFFHPFVWWIERRLSLEREMACDDAVLSQTASPGVYARCLTQIAERSFLRRQIALAQAAVNRVRQLSLRLEQILSSDRPAITSVWKPAVPLIAVLVLAGAAWELHAPRLVDFAEGPIATPSPRALAGNARTSDIGQTTVFRSPAQVPQVKLALASKKSGAAMAIPGTAVAAKRHYSNVPTGDYIVDSGPGNRRTLSSLNAGYRVLAGTNYFAAYQEVVFTSQSSGAAPVQHVSWQLVIWETRAAAPATQSQKRINPKT